MVKRTLCLFSIFGLILSACAPTRSLEALKEELLDVDRAFSQVSVASGQTAAFLEYMAPQGVIYPMIGEPIRGKDEFARQNSGPAPGSAESRLEWEPEFADVSPAGDLGYTLGKYRSILFQTEGETLVNQGRYVTIWKRQPDGTWKFVFDGGNQAAPIQNQLEEKE